LSSEQVVTLALRCGRVELELAKEQRRNAALKLAAVQVAERCERLERLLRRACVNGGAAILREARLG
jgi:hypothetical protein